MAPMPRIRTAISLPSATQWSIFFLLLMPDNETLENKDNVCKASRRHKLLVPKLDLVSLLAFLELLCLRKNPSLL